MNKKFSGLFLKLKSIKHIEVILAALFGLIVLLVFFSSVSGLGSGNSDYKSSSSGSYVESIENKLSDLLTQLDGAGKVDVMLMAENSGEEKQNNSTKIIAAVIVAEGASNIAVKINIIRAVQTLLSLNESNIEILQKAT